MELNPTRRKLLQAGLVLPAAGFLAFQYSSELKENNVKQEIIEMKKIKIKDRTIDIAVEQVEAFTVLGLTCRFTDPTGGGNAGKALLDDFVEEAKYYGISTDVTYSVTVEPSRVVNSKKYPPERPSFYFTYGVAVGDEYIQSAPFVFCLRRIPAGKYARVTVNDAEVGQAYAVFDPNNWDGNGPKPNWALSFQRSPSRFADAKEAQLRQDFYVSIGSAHNFILK